jgi:hypothetical protein
MIQHSTFKNGGYVLHKVMVNGTKYSAWFDAAGKLLDAEQITRSNVARPVPQRAVNVRAELVKIGARYKPAA